MLIEAFFQDEKDEIDELEIKLSNLENDLNEAVEDVDYEPESEKEDEEPVKKPVTAKAYLKDAIKELENEDKEEYVKERLGYERQLKTIETLEKEIKDSRAYKKECEYHLIKKLEVKRYGEIEVLTNLLEDLENLQILIVENKSKSKEVKKLEKKQTDLKEHILKLQNIIQTVAILTDEEARELTLKKHHTLIDSELNRGIKEELNTLVKIFENLKNKYQKSLITIEDELKQSEETIDTYLSALGYFDE